MLKANEAHLSSQDTLPPPNTVAVKPTHSFAYRCIDPHLSHIRTYPEALTTSPIISSKALFWWRVLAALWIVAIIPFSLARGEQETYLFYFTHLTWLGLGTWFLVGSFCPKEDAFHEILTENCLLCARRLRHFKHIDTIVMATWERLRSNASLRSFWHGICILCLRLFIG